MVTSNQQEVLKFIVRHRSRFAMSPTLREIVKEVGLSGNASAIGIVERLITLGYISRDNNTSRALIPTDKALELFEMHSFTKNYTFKQSPWSLGKGYELTKNGVAVSNPAESKLSYEETGRIETAGTTIKGDLNTIVETVVTLALGKIFNGTSTADNKSTVVKSLSNIVFQLFSDNNFISELRLVFLFAVLSFYINFAITKEPVTVLFATLGSLAVIRKIL